MVILLSHDKQLATALKRSLGLAGADALHFVCLPGEQGVRQFDEVCDRIESCCAGGYSDLRGATILVDGCLTAGCSSSDAALVSFDQFSIFAAMGSRDLGPGQLCAMLAMAFPEARLVVLSEALRQAPESEQQLAKYHVWGPSSSTSKGRVTGGADDRLGGFEEPFLFDPSGLRERIRRLAPTECSLAMLERTASALAIDEEVEYAYLHGYVAFRLGYTCHLISSESAMDRLLKGDSMGKQSCDPERASPPWKPELAFEDLYLNFPDRADWDTHLSNLEARDSKYGTLTTLGRRIVVTVGHTINPENRSYIADLADQRVSIVMKPCAGIYDLMDRAGLIARHRKNQREVWRKVRMHAREARRSGQTREGGVHSAPGRALVVAERLLTRAGRLFDDDPSIVDCIHGATLALVAQELLGYRTPTTSLEAITLRHKLEVMAECMFQGMEYNIEVKERFREIHGEVDAVSRWFNPATRERSALNAEMSIITEITRIFREHGQFEEEQECLKYFRRLNRQWYFATHPWHVPLYPFRWYVETLLGSFWLFVAALPAWPLLLGLLGFVTQARFVADSNVINTVGEYVANAAYTFSGLAPVYLPGSGWAHALSLVTVVAGFAHLGIFVSHLYTLVSRK